MREYFCGWYFKCQSDKQTLAIIPAVHKSKQRTYCSIQIITDTGAWNVDFPYEQYRRCTGTFRLRIGSNLFGVDGMRLCIDTPDCCVKGRVHFGAFSPLRYDIMGPFSLIPFMECRHSVVSMQHSVNGEISVNGTCYRFSDAVGYVEGDCGHSFPKEYAWTQCHFEDGSLMLSVADVPLAGFHFTGVIGVVLLNGVEYRLATYLGAKVLRIRKGELVIRQNDMVLYARLIEKTSYPLLAPINGSMDRTIYESACCRAHYSFHKAGRTLFSFDAKNAAFEYEFADKSN